ncbi:MAG TPA: hypothetical protein VFH83_04965 [Spirochaetia bacterium]|nr:hypothetical protein [Spirochaetia bacterium]
MVAHHGILEDGIDFIGKPYSPAEQTAWVRQVLDRKLGARDGIGANGARARRAPRDGGGGS